TAAILRWESRVWRRNEDRPRTPRCISRAGSYTASFIIDMGSTRHGRSLDNTHAILPEKARENIHAGRRHPRSVRTTIQDMRRTGRFNVDGYITKLRMLGYSTRTCPYW